MLPSLQALEVRERDQALGKVSELKSQLEESARKIHRLEAQVEMLVTELQSTRERLFRVELENAELRAESQKLRQENLALKQENALLKAEVAELKKDPRRKLPPWVKPNLSLQPEFQRRPGKKKLGAKVGHTPQNRKLPGEEEITREVFLVPKYCPDCHQDLPEAPVQWHRHIQIDLPAVAPLEVTRYSVGWSYCSYCRKQVSLPPQERRKLPRTLYGPRLQAEVAYEKFTLGLTLGKIQAHLMGRHGLKISTGELSEILTRAGETLAPQYEELQALLCEQDALYADETGWRQNGDNFFLWSFSSPELSVYRIEKRRSQRIVAQTLSQGFSGVLVSDCYGAYNRIPCRKQKCWAHFLRAIHEAKKDHPDHPQPEEFGAILQRFFELAKHLRDRAQRGEDIERALRLLETRTRKFLERVTDSSGAPWIYPLKKLRKRMLRHAEALYTFVTTQGLDATNNPAEREIRPAVLMRKTSYQNRSARGARTQAILMSLQRTCLKQGISFPQWAQDHFLQNSR